MAKVHNTPFEVAAHRGEVYIDGPGRAVVALTPEAAAETSDRLIRSVTIARAQLTKLVCERR